MRAILMVFLFSLLGGSAQQACGAELLLSRSDRHTAYAWVDGTTVGKIKRKPQAIALSAGVHELWVAYDSGGVRVRCHGLITVPTDGLEVVLSEEQCQTTDYRIPSRNSFFRGLFVTISAYEAMWVSVDGGAAIALTTPLRLNVEPGSHKITLYEPGETRGKRVQTMEFRGSVHQEMSVRCAASGCTVERQIKRIIPAVL